LIIFEKIIDNINDLTLYFSNNRLLKLILYIWLIWSFVYIIKMFFFVAYL